MDFEIKKSKGAKTIFLKSEITPTSLVPLEKTLNEIISDDKCNIVVDLENIVRLSSISLAVFIGCRNRLIEQDRTMTLTNVNENIKRLLQLASLNSFFK